MDEIIEAGYTRVSDILKIFSKYEDVPEDRLIAAQEKGTAVHDWIASYLRTKGKDFETDLFDLKQEYHHYGIQFINWYQALENFEVCAIEERFYDDDLMITGKCDLVLKLASKYVLIDYKTSYAKAKDWGLQLAAYAYLFMKNRSISIQDLYILHLKGKEDFKLYEYRFEEHFEYFVKCVELYRYLQGKRRGRTGILPLPNPN